MTQVKSRPKIDKDEVGPIWKIGLQLIICGIGIETLALTIYFSAMMHILQSLFEWGIPRFFIIILYITGGVGIPTGLITIVIGIIVLVVGLIKKDI